MKLPPASGGLIEDTLRACPDEPLVPPEIRDELLTRILVAAEELLDLDLPNRLHAIRHVMEDYEDELLEATAPPEPIH